MNATHHALPKEQFLALARGGSDPGAINRLVAAEHSKHQILLAAIANLAQRGDRPDDGLAMAALELLARVQRLHKGAADAVMAYPSVGAWALHTIRAAQADQPMPGARPSGLACVAAAAAVRAGIDTEIEVPVVNGVVTLPSLGAARAPGATAIVATGAAEVRSGGTRVTARPGAQGWRELRGVTLGSHAVVIDDLDPFRMPATDGEAMGRLTSSQVAEFRDALGAAWAVLSRARAAEIAAIVQVVVPYEAPAGGVVSTSSPQAFGTVAMSGQPDEYACAEILVHETQHLKLCALLDLVPLTGPDDGQRYYAPWRTDPRPASQLLQGAYAFLGVSGFWREQRLAAPEPEVRRRGEAEFARWRDEAAKTVDTLLGSGQLTRDGEVFVGEMAETLDTWRREPVPDEAMALARRKSERHLAQWQADNG